MNLQREEFRDKLSMIDAEGRRIPLFPAEVSGFWRRRRTQVQAVLILVFLLLPWINVNGVQSVLLDLEHMRFHFFGLRLWAHDAPVIFLLLGSLTLGLALMTALFGRVWCGWACPQTVFIDGVFRRIERWTEGTHLQRRALAAAPWNLEKILRKSSKWGLFVFVTLIITHSFLAYFVGRERLLQWILGDPREHPGPFLFMLATSAILLFDLAWFREQFCLIVCPYGRFQSVLFDSQTVTVQYDVGRGEPRKGRVPGARSGDCVNCGRCIAVCPTGIDIRNGVQMECIGCTACIDACDEIMTKVKKPTGLIRYMPSTKKAVHWFRPRVVLYGTFLATLVLGLAVALQGREGVDWVVFRGSEQPYVGQSRMSGERIVANGYRVHIHNQSDEQIQFGLTVKEPAEARLVFPQGSVSIAPDESKMIPFLVEIPAESLPPGGKKALTFISGDEERRVDFVAPYF